MAARQTDVLGQGWGKKVKLLMLGMALVGAVAAVLGGVVLWQRFVSLNFHTVVAGQVYRAAQPDGPKLTRWIHKYGLRTVVNLRGPRPTQDYKDEAAAAQAAGATLVPVNFPDQPSASQMVKLIEILEKSRRPMLLHCRAGADRTGIASALAAMLYGGADFEQAERQVSWQYLHFPGFSNSVDGLLEQYEAECHQAHRSTGGWGQFRQWVYQQAQSQDHVASARPADSTVSVAAQGH